ncbi:toll-like receptor 4 [Sinocyclocheilus rhinocerous]|uniref:toll-like receptor 4 n=1 Tax=Sinocyclocheilus rhinocerous TaxID=307959 RepID=UPI0007B7AB06|nr:PREDICTED: toll-like receptor 4 [Sinocyclocheilus rhinocerous]
MGRNLSCIPPSIPSSIQTLDFSFNVLKHLQKTVFPVLSFLRVLDLSRCQIEHIENNTFYNVKNLTTLILTGNPITYFGPGCLNSLHNLQRLVLVDAGLSSLQLQMNNLTKLRELRIGTNNIQSMSLPSFMSTFKDFSLLDLHANNISIIKTDHTAVLREIDFDTDSCVHKKRLTMVLSVCFVTVVVLLSLLVYRFQFYLQYCCILLRGYRSPGQQECSYDAFVIFSSYDEVWVMNELMENLENGVPPIQLCLHMRDFQAGKSIASNIIDEGIMGSRKIIVVVSQHFIDSAWCRFEFELAQSRFMMERNANIIIIILEDVEERKSKKVFGLHKHLKKNTYLKWSRDPLSNMRFWIRLRKAIIATNH